ncbi:NAD(P)-binding protein [Daedalea quercina L-15889]|uniref:NAD(P)-binding protein n=1 Tax=Daedalea quercina L-15889 TaxID=1314783 RepID=A0A165UKM4_9APHY|nr:NAD(P)-binding protein [Daedalea quercina L-15889]
MPSYAITGAARGIGYEFVRQLSAQPGNVVFGLIRSKSTAGNLFELAKNASNIHVLQADVADSQAVKEAAAEVAKITGGTLDCLINNAAFLEVEHRNYTFDTYPEEYLAQDMNKSFEVNVLGVIYTTNAFLPLIQQGSMKKVLTLSSGMGDLDGVREIGINSAGPYSVSKAAVNMVMVKYAARFKDEGIVFLTISPGLVNTLQGPPSPAIVQELSLLTKLLKKVYPNWSGKPLEPEESVRLQLEILERATIKDSGAFVSHHGNKQWV